MAITLSPKREYAPFEVSFDINKNDLDIINNENINTINQNFNEQSLKKEDLFSKESKPNIINEQKQIFNINNASEILKNKYEPEFKSNIEQKVIKNKFILRKNEFEENQFIDYLRNAMELENKIENLKIELSLRCDFNWEEIFRMFEIEGRGFLTRDDLSIGFNKFDLYPRYIDISLLLN